MLNLKIILRGDDDVLVQVILPQQCRVLNFQNETDQLFYSGWCKGWRQKEGHLDNFFVWWNLQAFYTDFMPKNPETLTYKVLLQNLEKRFSPRKLYFVERKGFYRTAQDAGEIVRDFCGKLQLWQRVEHDFEGYFCDWLDYQGSFREVTRSRCHKLGRLLIWLLWIKPLLEQSMIVKSMVMEWMSWK